MLYFFSRVVMELNEAGKMKNEEHEAYLAEIEVYIICIILI